MSEKSRLHRTRKEIIHSIKTQQQVEVFLAKEFERVMATLWPSSREEGHRRVFFITLIQLFSTCVHIDACSRDKK